MHSVAITLALIQAHTGCSYSPMLQTTGRYHNHEENEGGPAHHGQA